MKKKREHGTLWFLGWVLLILSTPCLIWAIKDKRFDDVWVCLIGCLIGVDDIIHTNTTVCDDAILKKDDDDLED